MRTLKIDEHDATEIMIERGWTDGLPVVPPTVDRVERMLEAAEVAGDDVLGILAARQVVVTAELVAANAVMAGCEPRTFPIVLAAVDAMMDPAFNAHAPLTSTGGAAFCVVVSGPDIESLGFNGGHNALGPGSRGNAATGRALRLLAMNALGARPGETDGTSIGNPGRYSLCFAESTPPAPWRPLRERIGYGTGDITVTVMATEGPRQVANHLNGSPEGLLASYASSLRSPTMWIAGKAGQAVFVVGPEHAAVFADAGITPNDIAAYVVEHSRIHPDDLAAAGVLIPEHSSHRMEPDADGLLPVIVDDRDVVVVTAGGAGPGWSAVIPSWASTLASRSTSRRVKRAGEELPACGPDGCLLPFADETEDAG